MKKALISCLLLTLCCYVSTVFAQNVQEVTWRHNFANGDITASNYNSPLVFSDVNSGESLTWNFDATWATPGNIYFGNVTPLQIGSAKKSAESFELSTNDIAYKVKEISVGASGAKNITGTVSVSIGDEVLGSESLSNVAEDFYFTNTNGAMGTIKVKFEQSSTVALYLSYIEITYEVETATDATITIGESGYATYASDKALDFSQVTDDEGNAADIVAYVVPTYYTNGKVSLLKAGGNAICEDRTIAANTGLIVKGTPGTYHVAFSDEEGNYFANLLKPVISAITLQPTDGEYTNFVLTADGFNATTGGTFGPNKAYLQIPTKFITDHQINTFSLAEDEDVSSIEETVTKKQSDEWYTLGGLRISQPRQKGLYLHNGRKVVVK